MNERNEKLARFIQDNPEEAKAIIECAVNDSTEAAATKLNQFGFDYTAKEMEEITDQVVSMLGTTEGELSDEALENVSGGVIPVFVLGYWAVCFGAGAAKALVDNWNRRRR